MNVIRHQMAFYKSGFPFALPVRETLCQDTDAIAHTALFCDILG
jgi:hypothetical protein